MQFVFQPASKLNTLDPIRGNVFPENSIQLQSNCPTITTFTRASWVLVKALSPDGSKIILSPSPQLFVTCACGRRLFAVVLRLGLGRPLFRLNTLIILLKELDKLSNTLHARTIQTSTSWRARRTAPNAIKMRAKYIESTVVCKR